MRKTAVAVTLTLLIGGGIWYALVSLRPQETEIYIPVPPVEVISPYEGTLTEEITIGGYVEAKNMVTVRPEASGRISSFYAVEGRKVFSGDLLAVLDKSAYQLRVDQAEAAYRAAEASYERVKQLYESGSATRQNYDQAHAQYDNQRIQYEIAKLELSYTNITAPVGGTVISTHTSEGSLVSPSVPVATIADLTQQQIRIHVPEVYYERFQRDPSSIEVTIRRPNSIAEPGTGTIIRVGASVDADSRSFEAVTSISRPKEYRPGMFVEVTCILTSHRDQLILPYRALTAGSTLWYVDPEQQTARSMTVQPLVEAEEGFSLPGEYRDRLFIVRGQHFLREGQRVRIIRQSAGGQ